MGCGCEAVILWLCRPPSLPPLWWQMTFERGVCWGVRMAFVTVDVGSGVKVYTVTSQKLPTSASIRRKVEVVPLSKKAAVMTSEPWPPPPPIPFEPPALFLLFIHSCYDNNDPSPPCLGSCICYQLNGQERFPFLSFIYIHTHSERWFIQYGLRRIAS